VKKQTMEAIMEAAEYLGLDVNAREDYSGRGMYGKKTCAVSCDCLSYLFQAVALASVRVLKKQGEYRDGYDHEAFVEDVVFSTDADGRGVVAY
jgi:hypothetical protein